MSSVFITIRKVFLNGHSGWSNLKKDTRHVFEIILCHNNNRHMWRMYLLCKVYTLTYDIDLVDISGECLFVNNSLSKKLPFGKKTLATLVCR